MTKDSKFEINQLVEVRCDRGPLGFMWSGGYSFQGEKTYQGGYFPGLNPRVYECYLVQLTDGEFAGTVINVSTINVRPIKYPGPLTRARCIDVWNAAGAHHGPRAENIERYMSPEERAHVKAVWDSLDGNSSWMTAFYLLKNGNAE